MSSRRTLGYADGTSGERIDFTPGAGIGTPGHTTTDCRIENRAGIVRRHTFTGLGIALEARIRALGMADTVRRIEHHARIIGIRHASRGERTVGTAYHQAFETRLRTERYTSKRAIRILVTPRAGVWADGLALSDPGRHHTLSAGIPAHWHTVARRRVADRARVRAFGNAFTRQRIVPRTEVIGRFATDSDHIA